MENQNLWLENEEFHFSYQAQDFCVQVFRSIILRGYKCKVLSMTSPFQVRETVRHEDLFDAIMEAVSIVDEKN